MDLANKVKIKREEKEITQAELAKKSGLTQATISRIESGELKQIKSEAIRSLAKALGVTADFLIGDLPKMEFDDTLRADETAKVIFRGYEKLSENERKAIMDFVEYLVSKKKKK